MRASDFRSDTVTRPTPAMREAMLSAEVGDDVLDGDPTVRRLEQRTAEILGKDAALFVPSGTMANQVALGAWTRPGDEIVVQRWAHVTTYEAGAPGYLHGLQAMTLGGLDGRMEPQELREALRPDFIHCPRTALLCLEQTHTVAAGRVMPLAEMDALVAVAREAGIPVHLDGARLFNATVASGVPPHEWASRADSVAICLSKGLGAPVGSLVAGDKEFVSRALLVRKRLGGWMRQAGFLAAAGLYALVHNVERLREDHELARELARRVGGVGGLVADPERVETNIVMVGVEAGGVDAAELAKRLGVQGVLVMPMGKGMLRFVTHMDVGMGDVERVMGVLGGGEGGWRLGL